MVGLSVLVLDCHYKPWFLDLSFVFQKEEEEKMVVMIEIERKINKDRNYRGTNELLLLFFSNLLYQYLFIIIIFSLGTKF